MTYLILVQITILLNITITSRVKPIASIDINSQTGRVRVLDSSPKWYAAIESAKNANPPNQK